MRAARDGAPGRRDRVFRRDRFTCVYCGEMRPEELTLDHVEPRMRGGDQSEGNLVTCCRRCNREKGGLPAWAWLSTRPEHRARFLAAAAATPPDATAVWPRLLRAVEQAAKSTV